MGSLDAWISRTELDLGDSSAVRQKSQAALGRSLSFGCPADLHISDPHPAERTQRSAPPPPRIYFADLTRCPHGESSHPAAGRSYDRFSTCRPKGPPARRTIGFQPVGPRAHRPVESQSLDSPPQTTPHQVSAPRAVGRTRPFDNPKNWPHQSTAAGPLLLIDSPLSLLYPLGLRPPDPATKNPRPRPGATKRVLTANQA